MSKIKTAILSLLTTITLAGLSASCDNQNSSRIEGVVATVNGAPITEFDLTLSSRSSGSHMQQPSVTDKKETLETLILQELAYQEAIKLGLDENKQYQKELSTMEAQVNAFKRKKLSDMFLQKQMLQTVEVSDDEALQYFKQHEQQLRTVVNVWQILSRSEDSIKKIQVELTLGTPFEEVAAKQFPNLQESNKKPWELGYLQWNQLPESWHGVINNMQIGDISNIIQGSGKRYWIIKLIDKSENTELAFEEIKPRVVDILKKDKFQMLRDKTIRELREKADIVYSK